MRKPRPVGTVTWRAPPPRAGRRWKPDFAVLAPPLAATAVAILALLWLNAGLPWPGATTSAYLPVAHAISVVDGDTIRIGGRLTRLTGFNAPETWKPNCAAERHLGEAATARLRQLVDGGDAQFASLRCACRPGTEGTMNCNYGRACGSLRVDGRDVGDILISEGLAVRFVCGATGCPPTPRPWCG
jgi:endonuclease YncB( thermonuclease family)